MQSVNAYYDGMCFIPVGQVDFKRGDKVVVTATTDTVSSERTANSDATAEEGRKRCDWYFMYDT